MTRRRPARRNGETVSLTEILDWIDPTALPTQVQQALEEIGPWLAHGLTYREIAGELDPPRSEDYVAAKVRMIREALVAEALRHNGMSTRLRNRLEQLRRSPSRRGVIAI